MNIHAALEYNDHGCMLYAIEYPGAFSRAEHEEECMIKLIEDIERYCLWAKLPVPVQSKILITQRLKSTLRIQEADTEIVLDSEIGRMTLDQYKKGKAQAMKSAISFNEIYHSIPKKLFTDLPKKKTFYGFVPRSAKEMYEHTNGVSDYYMQQVHVIMKNQESIVASREEAFVQLEKQEDFLNNPIYIGSGDEKWNVAKMLRRFVWHDRIHARAMYRMGVREWGETVVKNPFYF